MIKVLYVFYYSVENVNKATERLICSRASLINQDCDTICFYPGDMGYTGVFNKPKFINYAVKNLIKDDWFIFSDIDLIYPQDYIEKMKDYISEKPVRVIPWNYNIYQENYTTNISKLMELQHSPGGFAHGNGLIHRESFLKIHGLDEFYIGYAPEDDDLNKRLEVCGNQLIYNINIETCHLYHSPLNRIQHERNMEYYEKRLQELNKDNIIVNGEKWGEL